MAEGVVLVHGLWLAGFSLRPLSHHLERAGYTTRALSYHSVSGDPGHNAELVARAAREIGTDTVHLVGHSLGGLLILAALHRQSRLPPGRVVMLGTPLSGSAVARAVSRYPGGEWLLGDSQRILEQGFRASMPDRDVGMIAGRLGFGLGSLFTHLEAPHDGTVSVSETRYPGLADHLVLRVSHMSMLLSSTVHRQVGHFLEEGAFAHGDA